jgi:hypothetical protein
MNFLNKNNKSGFGVSPKPLFTAIIALSPKKRRAKKMRVASGNLVQTKKFPPLSFHMLSSTNSRLIFSGYHW